MNIVDYFESENREHWLGEIAESEWRSGKYLHDLLKSGQLFEKLGSEAKVLLLIDNDSLLSFCTLSKKKYDIDTELSPWVGFVYTYPKYRGHRYSEKLIEHAQALVRQAGFGGIYESTKHEGLYERYGFAFHSVMADWRNEKQKVYFKPVTA